MPLPYTSYRFLYPPRPERKVYPMQLSYYENQGFWAQYKKNGTNNVIAISPSREVTARQRRNIPHVLWSASPHTATPFRRLKGGWYVFVAELIHSKVAGAKAIGLTDINYIHDILVADGKQLTGSTFSERQTMLADMFGAKDLPVGKTGSHWVIDKHTWLARNHTSGFRKMFENLSSPEDEGLVLKNPKARLSPCSGATANADWQVKIRVPHENYDA